MRRAVIVSGGSVSPSMKNLIQPNDLLIGADRGALWLIEQGYKPEIAIGDFDSVLPEQMESIRERSGRLVECDPVWKDYTDTEMAFETALSIGPSSIMMLGVLGTRLDHSLANIHLLKKALEAEIPCKITDEHNQIQLTRGMLRISQDGYKYVTLLPLTTKVTGITLTGFKYPLNDAEIEMGQSIGVSNELLEELGTINIRDGLLLVIQSKD
ncbi:thiamine diphosphokinase [Marinicrinis lubricantis]|uniref:Thiamine diphosphokinase n=1 Tax=Marinicrinis lubricantis TaxID=2086470 RepID=A0ABW1ILC9_9BACL